MITVKNLLNDPLFEDFILIAGKNGLGNAVCGTGIFDWETPDEIRRTFNRGDFVLTTYSKAKEHPQEARECIKAFFSIGISALAIRSIYYNGVEDEIIEIADKMGIPVFIFKKSYTEDIIYFVKKRIAEELDKHTARKIAYDMLANNEDNDESTKKFIEKNGIHLFQNTIYVYC